MSEISNGESGASVRAKINNAISATFPEFTATGAISTGDAVALRSDGTVEVVSGTSDPAGAGSPTVFNDGDTRDVAVTYDSANNKVVVAYRDSSNSTYGTAVVGTVSGKTISFGTPVVFNSASTSFLVAAYDSTNGRVVIFYRDNGNSLFGTAIVGTVSGTSISFGSPTVFQSSNSSPTKAVYDVANDRVVVSFTNSGVPTTAVGTVSGSGISFGTPVEVIPDTAQVSLAYDSTAGKVVVAYSDGGNTSRLTVAVGTVSGSSISFGTPEVISAAVNISSLDIVYDSAADKSVVVYRDGGNGGYGTAALVTVSGTTASIGTPVVFETAIVGDLRAVFDSTNDKVVVTYSDQGNSNYGTLVVGTVSGASITFGSPTVFKSGDYTQNAVTYDSTNDKVVISYRAEDNTDDEGEVVVYATTTSVTTNASNFLGFAQNDAADTEPVAIATSYTVDHTQTGLTPMQTYWVDSDGTLATSDTGYSVAGYALTATQIRVGG